MCAILLRFCVKKFNLLLLAIIMITDLFGQAWQNIGSPSGVGYSNPTAVVTQLDSNNTPYIFYSRTNTLFGGNNAKSSYVIKYNGLDWDTLGNVRIADTSIQRLDLAISKQNTPYILYQDDKNNYATTVKKFDGINWQTVGTAGFTPSDYSYGNIIMHSDTPYVAFVDVLSSKTNVMKFNGTNWVYVGNSDFSTGQAKEIKILVNHKNIPYVAFLDENQLSPLNQPKVTCMKLNGSSWVNVGSAGFTPGASSLSLAIDPNDTVYVAFRDRDMSGKASAMKFDGTNWVQVGSRGFSPGTAEDIKLAIDNNSNVYVGFIDYSISGGDATVMKYEGGGWLILGSQGFSTPSVFFTNLNINSNNAPVFTCSSQNYIKVYEYCSNSTAPTNTSQSVNLSVCAGNKTLISAKAINGGSIKWYANSTGGNPLATGNTFTTPKLNTNTTFFAEEFTCSPSATRTPISISVNTSATVSASTLDSTICSGQSTTLVGNGPSSFNWKPGNLTGFLVNVSPTSTTTYTLIGNAGGCKDSTQITIYVNSPPSVNFTTLSPICQTALGTPLTGGNPTGGTYSGPTVNSGVFFPSLLSTGNYTLTYTYTDYNGCSNSDTSNISVINCFTGINNTANVIDNIKLSPNPANDYISISTERLNEIRVVSVYTVDGKLGMDPIIFEKNSVSGLINISSLENGIYFLKIQTLETIYYNQFIKQ